LLEELESLSPAQRAKRLAQIQGRLVDAEQDEDDLDDSDRDVLANEFTNAMELDQLRAEIAALRELLAQARRVRDQANDSRLAALRECLAKAEFNELKDGRGRLLIFTEHRDTLNHLLDHLTRWGYTTCQIHGGMNPHERKRAQEEFRTSRQICVATEAAGEGINLQFCRLMINYDLPCAIDLPHQDSVEDAPMGVGCQPIQLRTRFLGTRHTMIDVLARSFAPEPGSSSTTCKRNRRPCPSAAGGIFTEVA
jgi:SNF2 family DNA or RNA helicase